MIDVGRLLIQIDGQIWSVLPLNLNRQVLVAGREPSNDVTLPDRRVSRHHAELRIDLQGVAVTDLGSLNGTFVGDTRLLAHRPYHLDSGASFRIGPYLVTYQGQEYMHTHPTAAAQEPTGDGRRGALPEPEPPAQPRRLEPSTLPPGPLSQYLRDLPAIYQDSSFLGRYLLIFESIWEPLEQRQDHLDMYFDPRSCPASFLPWMADWLGLPVHAHWPESRARERLREAMDLYRWRGTAYGMARMIEVSTGLMPEITENAAEPCVFHVRVRIPSGFPVDRDQIEALIEAHKPAHAGYVLDVEQ
jgi:phage tail-like protein